MFEYIDLTRSVTTNYRLDTTAIELKEKEE